MAAITSTAAGSWSAGGTWVGGVKPSSTDTAILAHAVVVDSNETVGNNGGSTAGITMNAGSALTINTGFTLTCSGRLNVSSNTRDITIQAGATLTFTNTGGVAGIITGSTGCRLIMTGTLGNRATISYTGVGGQATVSTIVVQATYATFSKMKNSSTGMIFTSQGAVLTSVDHCLFQLGEFVQLNADAGSDSTFTNNSFTGTTSTSSLKPNFTAATTGIRTITGNVLDKAFLPLVTAHLENMVFNLNLIEDQFFTSTAAGGAPTSVDSNLFAFDYTSATVKASAGLGAPGGTFSNNYLLGLNSANNNHHFWSVAAITANGTFTFDGNVYEYGLTGTSGDLGDCVLADQGSNGIAAVHLYAKNEYVLPSAGGVASGQGINNAKKCRGTTVGAEHCTYFVRSGSLPLSTIPGNSQYARGGGCVERGATDAFLGSGIFEYYRNNISWADVSNAGYHLVLSPDTATGGVDSGTSTNITTVVLTDTGKTWGTNIFTAAVGAGTYKVRITGGVGVGAVGTVSSNTSNTVTVSSWAGGAGTPTTGDLYTIFIVDVAVEAQCKNNCGYNLAAGELYNANNAIQGSLQGNGYHQANTTSGSALGTNDITANPNFVDPTRNIRTWDLSLGGAGTNANALAELRKKNDDEGYNSAYTISALLTYVKAGFTPRNAALIAASDNVSPSNGWIGAQQGAPASGNLTLLGAG